MLYKKKYSIVLLGVLITVIFILNNLFSMKMYYAVPIGLALTVLNGIGFYYLVINKEAGKEEGDDNEE